MAEATPGGYATELRREIMRSEIQRARVLAIFLAALLAVAMIMLNLLSDVENRIFRTAAAGWLPVAGIGPFLLYEIVVVFALRRRAAMDKDFPRPARYANALIETSLPSVAIFVLSQHMDPVLVFGYWPPMLYFLFILLSTLRLDFWLSLWTGVVAATQQVGLVLWLLPIDLQGTGPETSLVYHCSRSALLLIAGVVAGIVAGSIRRRFEKAGAAARAPASPPCSASTSRRPWSIACWRPSPIRPARCAKCVCCSSTSEDSPPCRASGRPTRRWRCSTTSSPRWSKSSTATTASSTSSWATAFSPCSAHRWQMPTQLATRWRRRAPC